MKLYIKLLTLLTISIFFSCEDVIDVELQKAPERLVIEASLDWEKGTTGNNQTIKLSTSSAYFAEDQNTPVTNAAVKVTNTNSSEEFIFASQNNGSYTTTTFNPIVGNTYDLEVIYNSETYIATETLQPVTDITRVEQSTEKGFDDEILEVSVYFNDPEDEKNFYLFRFKEDGDLFFELEDGDDEFINGNEVDWWYEKDEEDNQGEFTSGDRVELEMYGISEAYHNYIRTLIEQSEGVGLFGSTPVALKGNCLNQTNADNYAYGYFRLTQVVKTNYTFE
ncbi:uncharacterized protein DUF4249 [Maribacter vaceletii]|uniref:Uncharacterized protein DUF4249 n=1 Tax=Maribacter vaceletii TaxID=1206816 RepID=A0A495DWC6_9FLAO|nr:DUF4249 domain-containing protein [Maribacter vaceletii]RKR07907.1 uncharacterized protein DUF4249 [Maribacter vaceletii]